MQVAIQIIAFLIANKDTIKQIVVGLEQLAGDVPGNTKAQAVKDFIAKAMSVEGQIEAAWPMVAPVFNLFVAAVKKPA